MTASAPPGWEDILDPGEQILWQGRPEVAFDWAALLGQRSLQGLFLCGFALLWIVLTSGIWGGMGGAVAVMFLLFALPILVTGIGLIFAKPVSQWLRLRGSYYTLSDSHVFIATQILGRRRLQRYALASGLRPALEEGLPGSVWFAAHGLDTGALARGNLGGFARSVSSWGEKIGFEHIPEARRVHRLMLDAIAALRAPP